MQSQQPLRAADLLREIRQGKIAPVYLLTGEADYLIEAALEKMLDLLLPAEYRDFNLTILSGVEATVEEITSIAATYPMLSDRRIIVVKDPLFLTPQKQDSPLVLLRDARRASDVGSPLRAVNLCARLLGLTPGELADTSIASSTIQTFIAEHGEQLSAEERSWLLGIPDVAAQLDLSSDSTAGDEKERLLQWLQGDLPNTSVVIFTITGRLDTRTKLFKAFRQVGRALTLELPRKGHESDPVYKLVVQKLAGVGKSISPRDLQRIRERTGDDLHLLFEEIEKLISFVGHRPRIETNDIDQIVTKSRFDQIFALTDALAKKDLPRALSSLYSTLAGGEPPIKVHAMITRQIRLTLQAKLLVQKGILPVDVSRMDSKGFNQNVYKQIDTAWRDLLPESRQLNLLRQHPVSVYLLLRNLSYYSLGQLHTALERLL